MFVVLEGLDGVGKSTLVRNLADHFNGEARNTPGCALRPFQKKILDALGSNQLARCIFYASTVFAEGRRARELADRGNIVFIDRYWLSTIAYARARGVTEDLSSLEAIVPRPDVTVLLTLEEEERQRRMKSRGHSSADCETLNKEFRVTVLRELRNPERGLALRPVEIDITGADENEAMQKILLIVFPNSNS